jgi:hypothetical protein
VDNAPDLQDLSIAMSYSNQRSIKIGGRRQPLQFALIKRLRLAKLKPMQTCGRPVIAVETAGLL